MKYHGSIIPYAHQRNSYLMKIYRQECSERNHILVTDEEFLNSIINHPCPRFWVSEERALVVISNLLDGVPVLDTMHPSKREMFQEIYKRVVALRKEHPDKRLYDIVFDVVNSPAPKFYLQPRSALQYIYKIKKSRYKTSQH